MTRLVPILLLLCLTGCATRFETMTWLGTSPDEPIKRTVIKQSWWLGLPALAPMDVTLNDGDFIIETKAIGLPSFDVGTLFRDD